MVITTVLAFTGMSCELPGSDDDGGLVEGNWLIPKDEIVDGGPGQDGIPSIDNPEFAGVNDVDYVGDQRLVVGFRIGDEVRAYPHQVMDHHEIVNDVFQERYMVVTHCPLTGTAMAWDREIDGEITEFGVSGLLFRNNLIAFDRNTESFWPQMQLRSVHGEHSGRDAEHVQVIETTWETWRASYPDSQVLTTDTGFQRDYSGFAYGRDYLTDDDDILFPITNPDDRLPNKERVHGIIGDTPADESVPVTVYVVDDFDEGVELIEDDVGPGEYIVAGSSEHDFVSTFEAVLEDGTRPEFSAVNGELPVIMEDGEGNRWDMFGYAVEGPNEGERLMPARSYTGYYFAWADFFPDLDIYGRE